MKTKSFRFVGALLLTGRRTCRRMRMYLLSPLFRHHGKNFWFDPDGVYTFGSICVGDDVSLGLKPVMMAALSEIRIGNKVMFGPGVTVVGGGHNISIPGQFMVDVQEKTANEDLGVTIDDDVWVGTRAVILRGVHVGRGAVVAAGSVVTKSVPPYAVVGGNPARVLRFRWDVATIMVHETTLYPPENRFKTEDLNRWQTDQDMLPPMRQRS